MNARMTGIWAGTAWLACAAAFATDADYVEAADLARATALRARAKKLYLRARGYGLRGLEARHPGFGQRLRSERDAALAGLEKADVPLLYWTAAPWAAATSMAKEDPELTADQGLFEALMRRAPFPSVLCGDDFLGLFLRFLGLLRAERFLTREKQGGAA